MQFVQHLINQLKNSRFGEEKGATAVEYTVLLALIIVAIVGSIVLLGDALVAVWDQIVAALPAGGP